MWLYWNLYLAKWGIWSEQKPSQHSFQSLLCVDNSMCVYSRHEILTGWDNLKCWRFFKATLSLSTYAMFAYLGLLGKAWQPLCSYVAPDSQLALHKLWTKLWNIHWDTYEGLKEIILWLRQSRVTQKLEPQLPAFSPCYRKCWHEKGHSNATLVSQKHFRECFHFASEQSCRSCLKIKLSFSSDL